MVNETNSQIVEEKQIIENNELTEANNGKEKKPISREKKERESLLDIIKLISPGTSLRTGIDNIVNSGKGALIVINSPKINKISEGGFKVNAKFTSQKLVELAKMDGAIILSQDMKKILVANATLIPDRFIETHETGTRHKAAERTANQASTFTIAISERRNTITLYYKEFKYNLRSSEEILRRATETLQILEKQKDLFDELISNLNVLEVTNLVVAKDVCAILQRIETISRISSIIKRYLIELGREGAIISLRFKELTKNLEKEQELILKDYLKTKINKVKQIISRFSFDDLLDSSKMSKLIFEMPSDEALSPKGYRLLSKTGLTETQVKKIVNELKNIQTIFDSNIERIQKIFRENKESEHFYEELKSLKEQIIVGKKI